MLFELSKYKSNNHFFFEATDELGDVYNAPKYGMGIYLVYALQKGKVKLIYIGSSGKVRQSGSPQVRKGGLYDRIVNGKQFDAARKKSWKQMVISEDIDALDIYWYETFDDNVKDIPTVVEGFLLQEYFDATGKLPKWNKEF